MKHARPRGYRADPRLESVMDNSEMMKKIASGTASARELADFARAMAQSAEIKAQAERKVAEEERACVRGALCAALEDYEWAVEAHKDRAYRVTAGDDGWRVEIISTVAGGAGKRGKAASADGGARYEFPHLIDGRIVGTINKSDTARRARRLWVEGWTLAQIAAETQPNAPENTAMTAKNIGDAAVREALRAGLLDPDTLDPK